MMKYYLTILFITFSLTVSGTKWYVSTTGNDDTGEGTEVNPWASVYKAALEVRGETYYGDTIYLKNGTYYAPASASLGVQINVMGESEEGVILKTNISTNPFYYLYLYSEITSPVIKGNQFIKNLTFDGDKTTLQYAIYIRNREYITIEHCSFYEIKYCAIDSYCYLPEYADSVNVRHCYFYDASGASNPSYGWSAKGAVAIGGIDNSEFCYNEIISPYAESSTQIRGIPMTFNYYHARRWKIHNNIIKKYARSYEKGFAFEFIGGTGGIEVYDNTFRGAMDMNRISTGDEEGCEYGLKYYRNLVECEENISQSNMGATMEAWAEGVYIYQNTFRNVSSGVHMAISQAGDSAKGHTRPLCKDIYIMYNLFEDVGGEPKECYAVASTDKIYAPSHGLSNGHRIRPDYSGELPGGLSVTNYYVRDAETDSFRVASSYSGSAVDILSDGYAYYCSLIDNPIFSISNERFQCDYISSTDRVHQYSDSYYFLVSEGTEVIFEGTVPVELETGRVYYARNPHQSTNTFQLSGTIDGEIINFSSSENGYYRFNVLTKNVNILNNTVQAKEFASPQTVLNIQTTGDVESVIVRNNIFTNVWFGMLWGTGELAVIDTLIVTNNIYYNFRSESQNKYEPYYSSGFAEKIEYSVIANNQIEVDPMFLGGDSFDFNLQPTSPAINAGVDVGLTTDYAGNTIVGLPDIGAYEWYEGITVSGILIDADGNFMIDSNGNIMTTE